LLNDKIREESGKVMEKNLKDKNKIKIKIIFFSYLFIKVGKSMEYFVQVLGT